MKKHVLYLSGQLKSCSYLRKPSFLVALAEVAVKIKILKP